jgi:ureidoglycolate lyase/2,4-diketo-3-deoxy-L-fuconate hydrolase
VTKDEIANVQDLALSLEVDGKVYQDDSTRNMIIDVPTLIAYISQLMIPHTGEVIITGTPAGVGLGQKSTPIYLQTGQSMKLEISGLGEQRQRLVAV